MCSRESTNLPERRRYTFAESLAAVDRNAAVDPCSAQWILIWMYGAYVDEVPSDSQRRNIDVFYRTLTDMCKNGQQCFQRFVTEFPPRTDSRRALLGWVQMAENSCRIQNKMTPRIFKYVVIVPRLQLLQLRRVDEALAVPRWLHMIRLLRYRSPPSD
ncbi:hypothetical protein, conserved [Babesia bigemina]|uniref:thiol oxidase n=1 Tax=Babesia bigemina TaxID=5866 RepID=A0A061DCG2_BABBI|nr:hypothetical protein, conserved [Babesia bigemina]CDR95540.1 hypothetical protein, conserved [Babesia bigemina]|eukprot:XP_012767726.1 hypothetical protein, conserved [Babesia bigemina]